MLPTADTAVSPWDSLSLSPGIQYAQSSARRRHGEIHAPFSLHQRWGASGGRCLGCPLPTGPESILSSAVMWPLLVGQECQLALWGWLEVTQV